MQNIVCQLPQRRTLHMKPYAAYIHLMAQDDVAKGKARIAIRDKMRKIWKHMTPEDKDRTDDFAFELEKLKR